MSEMIEITIEIETKLLYEAKKRCLEREITVEQLIVSFLRFCACPENRESVRKWFESEKGGKE